MSSVTLNKKFHAILLVAVLVSGCWHLGVYLPQHSDSDSDMLSHRGESNVYHTNPRNSVTDLDSRDSMAPCSLLADAELTDSGKSVYLLIYSTIYEPLESKIDRWINDVEQTGVTVLLKIVEDESANQIRELLQETPSIIGCLMVGDIPYVTYETTYEYPVGVSHYETFPTDLFYMDLDGNWIDEDGDGHFDAHGGDIAPEIWVGRLKASTLSGDEVELLRNYFDKNHFYRIGALTLPHRALIYTDHYLDYYTYELTPETEGALEYVYSEIVTVAYPQTTSASDYLGRLQEGWSFVRLLVHSGGFGHYFGNQTDGKVYPYDIKTLDPEAFFYIITSCGNFDYRLTDYIGGWYVFSDSYSLLAIGDSGVHDLFVHLPDAFFLKLRNECFGSAYLYYLQECVWRNLRIDSVHNAIMIGDPLLKVQYNGQDSDGDGLSDQYELDIGIEANIPDSDIDGLTDYKEVKHGTNPLRLDSDGDGLTDGEEVNVYSTDPLTTDTDGDGLSDKREVEVGSDPLEVDSDGDGWNDSVDIMPTQILVPNTPIIGLIAILTIWITLKKRKEVVKSEIVRNMKNHIEHSECNM